MSPACLQSIGHLSDFHWPCPSEIHWTSIGLGVGLLFVHWKSVRKVCQTLWSNQKCPDKHRKIIGKILGSNSRKKLILLTLSPLGVHSEKQWECKDLNLRYIPYYYCFPEHFTSIPFYFVVYSIYMRACTVVTHTFASVTYRDNQNLIPFLVLIM